MGNLSQDVAFFSSVEVDSVIRKEPTDSCATPSNPQGLSQGCGVPDGQGYTMEQLCQMELNAQE